MLGWLKRDRTPLQGTSTSVLPDELVVDILSRLPLKSICRFKCVCKSWLAFSSHTYYRQKLPRTPAGLLYRKRVVGTAIHLARLPAGDREIDTSLNFVPPRYKDTELLGCSNGLLLCNQGGNKREAIYNAVVCNPATKEWMEIPDTEPGPPICSTDIRLCFDPLWSQDFYVFKFQSIPHMIPHIGTTTEVEVFFSENSSWSGCLWETEHAFVDESLFVNGVLYVMHLWDHKILALDAPDTRSQWLNHRIIQLPGFTNGADTFNCCDGCLCQSSGLLCYAKQELDGCAVRIWSLESPDEWVVKQRVRMTGVFGRDVLINTGREGYWYFDYDILAFDLERDLVILVDTKADKIISVSISTGKGSQFVKIPEKFTELHHSLFYVPYYGEVPALVR
uniref:Uncharacterized protein n=1 Tax=Avena sativa TaxID=4498 RepID=A0ACD5WCL1_AVESA